MDCCWVRGGGGGLVAQIPTLIQIIITKWWFFRDNLGIYFAQILHEADGYWANNLPYVSRNTNMFCGSSNTHFDCQSFFVKCVIFLYPLETFEVISTFFERCKHMKQDKIANVQMCLKFVSYFIQCTSMVELIWSKSFVKLCCIRCSVVWLMCYLVE